MYHPLLKTSQILLVVLLGSSLWHTFAKHRRLKLKWNHFECKIKKDIVSDCTCEIVQPRGAALHVDITVIKELRKLKVHTVISTKYSTTAIYRRLFENTVDGCRVIANLAQNGFVTKIYGSIMKATNQPKKCPIGKGLYYYHNISVEEVLPSFIPACHIMTEVYFSNLDQLYLNITLQGTVEEH